MSMSENKPIATTPLRATPAGHADIRLERTEECWRGFARLRRYHFSHRRYDGGQSPVLARELFDSGDAVVVLPYDPVRDVVVLVEQIRVSPIAHDENPYLIECIAGRIGAGETPQDVAHREAREEAGAVLGALEPIAFAYVSPGIIGERMHLFAARCDSAALGGVHGVDSEHEDIRVILALFDEAQEALARGDIRVAPAIITLQWLALNRERLRRAWLA
jgi:ADP-ribose pyrophosphatase